MATSDDEIESLRRMLHPENQPYSPEREERYKAEFPYLSMSPEEFVARHAHQILAFSLHRYQYQDQRLKAWFQDVYELLRDRARVRELRREYLTPAEIEAAERSEENP